MRDYQLAGLNWLIRLYENGINGILADEMVCMSAMFPIYDIDSIITCESPLYLNVLFCCVITSK